MPPAQLQLGVIGLGTMGANLARNAARNKATVAVYNRTPEKTDAFMKEHGTQGKFVACHSLKELVKALKKPRPILLMVKAGDAVDIVIQELLPLLDEGDILIDGGNSHFRDTERRQKELAVQGVTLLGMGVSGGEEGALSGPSLMPGGDEQAYRRVQLLLGKMAASDGAGGTCVAHLGFGGSGHFVKMVHNGIEYGLMQLLAETYDLMKNAGGMTHEEIAAVYDGWNQGDLQSFLLEIAGPVLRKKDEESGEPLIDRVKDVAGQKGTGKWTTQSALELGVAIPTITAAVDARILSADPERRRENGTTYPETLPEPYPEAKTIAELAESAYRLSSLCAYAQGFELLKAANEAFGWNVPLGEVARIWRGGCIIRSALLEKFQASFGEDEAKAQAAKSGLLDLFRGEAQLDWRGLVSVAVSRGIPVPCLAASLHYYDAERRSRLPQNFVQGLRDRFGAHTFERTDREGVFHVNWKN